MYPGPGGGGGGVTYPGLQGIIGAPRYNRGPGGPKLYCIMGMQFKRTCTTDDVLVFGQSQGGPPPARIYRIFRALGALK